MRKSCQENHRGEMRLKYTKEASATSVCEGMVLAQSAVEDTSREGMTQLQIPSDPKLVFSVKTTGRLSSNFQQMRLPQTVGKVGLSLARG